MFGIRFIKSVPITPVAPQRLKWLRRKPDWFQGQIKSESGEIWVSYLLF